MSQFFSQVSRTVSNLYQMSCIVLKSFQDISLIVKVKEIVQRDSLILSQSSLILSLFVSI